MRRQVRGWWSAGALGSALLLGCGGETSLPGVVPGLTADSVVVLLGHPRGQESYLAGGHLWQILYYSDTPDSAPPLHALVPVVLADERVAGVGWSYWESEARRLRVALPPR